MKLARLMMIITLLTLLGAPAAWAQVTLKDGQLNYSSGGAKKILTLDAGQPAKVRGSEAVFTFVADPEVLKAAKAPGPALLFFNKNGALAGVYAGRDGFDPEMCQMASMSPDGKTIALDNGTWLVRVWTFLKYPQMTPVNPAVEEPFISYLSTPENGQNATDLVWVDNDTVIVTDISEAPVSRPCPSDPCEPLDVVVHRLSTWNPAALAKGDELCDYSIKSLSGRTVTVNKTCARTIDDWAVVDDPALRQVTEEKIEVPDK